MEKVIITHTETITIKSDVEISEDEIVVLKTVQDRLILAGDELKRMEDEGGPPMNKEQASKAEAFSKAGAQIAKALPLAEELNPLNPKTPPSPPNPPSPYEV